MDEARDTRLCPKFRLDSTNVGRLTAVETMIAVAGTKVLPPRVTAEVRVARSAAWTTALAATPAGIVTVHCVAAGRSSPPTVRVREASDAPVSAPAALKVVVPHPSVVGESGVVAMLNVGRTKTSSSAAVRGAFNENMNEADPVPVVTGLDMSYELDWNEGATSAGDVMMAPDGSAPPARVLLTARDAKLAPWT